MKRFEKVAIILLIAMFPFAFYNINHALDRFVDDLHSAWSCSR